MQTETSPSLSDLDVAAQARLHELPKMSTTLLELAAPLIDDPRRRTEDEFRLSVLLAASAWNATDDASGPAEIARQISRNPPEWVRQAPDILVRRRRELFADDPRTVGPPRFVAHDDDSLNVQVPVVLTATLLEYLEGPEPPDRLAGVAPAFAALLRERRLDHRFVVLGIPSAIPTDGSFRRRSVHVGWRAEEADWDAPELESLARGDGTAPADSRTQAFTRRYVHMLHEIEHAVLCVAHALPQVPSNRRVREAYRFVRTRPCGETADPVAIAVWQGAAMALARRPFSMSEVAAVLAYLERSAKTHERWPGGADYIDYLRHALRPL